MMVKYTVRVTMANEIYKYTWKIGSNPALYCWHICTSPLLEISLQPMKNFFS